MNTFSSLQNNIFNVVIVLTYILYIVITLGFTKYAPKYLETLDYYVKIYVSLFLIWRFNGFRKIHFNDLDAKIAFNAGIFLLMTTALNGIILNYYDKFKSIIQKISIFNLSFS